MFYFGTRTAGRFLLICQNGQMSWGIRSTYGYSALMFENLWYMDDSTNSYGGISVTTGSQGNVDLFFIGGLWTTVQNKLNTITTFSAMGGNIIFDGISFQWPGYNGAANTYLFSIGQFIMGAGRLIIRNCINLTTSLSALLLLGGPPSYISQSAMVLAENNQGFSVNANLGILNLMLPNGGALTGYWDQTIVIQQNVGPQRQSRVESNNYVRDWEPGAGFPTLTAALPSGTLWSYRLTWPTQTMITAYHVTFGTEVLKMAKTVLAAGYKNVDVELYVQNGQNLTSANIAMAVTYVYNGVQYVEYSPTGSPSYGYLGGGSPVAIPASAAQWAANSFPGYSPFKLAWQLGSAITGFTGIDANTEIMVSIRILTPPAASSSAVSFIHPDIGLS